MMSTCQKDYHRLEDTTRCDSCGATRINKGLRFIKGFFVIGIISIIYWSLYSIYEITRTEDLWRIKDSVRNEQLVLEAQIAEQKRQVNMV